LAKPLFCLILANLALARLLQQDFKVTLNWD